MTKVSMRVDYTLEGYSISDQIKIAKEAGVDAVETGELMGLDCKEAARVSAKLDIPFVACGFYDIWNARIGAPFGEIEKNLLKTIDCAKELGTNLLLSLTIDSIDRGEEGKKAFVENMMPVAELCVKEDMIIALEPHSTKYTNPLVDMSGYFLDSSKLAYELIDRMNCPNVKILFDFYHIQTMEGDILMNIKQNIDEITHFHIAGVPERDEPMNGELHYQNIVNYVNNLGYDKYFGLEYFPADATKIDRLKDVVEFIKSA